MLALYILALMILVGWIASKRGIRRAYLYALVAGIGALAGAFAAFGDMPLPVQTRLPIPFVTSLIGALIFVGGLWLWRRNKSFRRNYFKSLQRSQN